MRKVRMWSFQPDSVAEALRNGFAHNCDITLSQYYDEDYRDMFIPAYDWLRKRIIDFIGEPPEGVTYPVWTYYTRSDGKNRKPDLRYERYRYPKNYVLLELLVPWDRVVFLESSAWNDILNKWPILGDMTDEELEASMKHIEPWTFDKIVQTWDAVFDYEDAVFDYENNEVIDAEGNLCYTPIEAVMWEFKPEDVVKIHAFISGENESSSCL